MESAAGTEVAGAEGRPASAAGPPRVLVRQPPPGLLGGLVSLAMLAPIAWPIIAWGAGIRPAWAVDHPAAYQSLLALGVLVSVVWFTGTPIRLRAPEGTVLLPEESLWWNWRVNWWTAASYFAALPALATSLWEGIGGWWLGTPPQSAGQNAFMAVALAAVLLLMVGGMRERQRAWMDPRGIQTSILYRFDWGDLRQATEDGDAIVLFHRARPTVGSGCVRIADESLRARVLAALRSHGVPIEPYPAEWDGARTGFLVLRAVTAIVCWTIVVLMPGWWVWGLLAAFVAWIVLQLGTERLRGLHLLRQEKPAMEPIAPAGDAPP